MRRSRAVILGSIALSLCAALLIGSRLPGRRAEPAVMQQELAQEEVRLPIVMYHSVVDDPARQGDYVVTPQTVREDLQYLKSRGYQSVTLAQLVDYVYHGGDLPEKPVLITFDDGCYNNYQYVLPILQQLEMTAVISPVASWSEQADADGSEHTIWSYLRGERMLEMAMTGYVEFANHSYDLHQVGARKGALRKTGEGEESSTARCWRRTRAKPSSTCSAAACPSRCFTPIPSAPCPPCRKPISKRWAFWAPSAAGSGSTCSAVTRTACISWGGSTGGGPKQPGNFSPSSPRRQKKSLCRGRGFSGCERVRRAALRPP